MDARMNLPKEARSYESACVTHLEIDSGFWARVELYSCNIQLWVVYCINGQACLCFVIFYMRWIFYHFRYVTNTWVDGSFGIGEAKSLVGDRASGLQRAKFEIIEASPFSIFVVLLERNDKRTRHSPLTATRGHDISTSHPHVPYPWLRQKILDSAHENLDFNRKVRSSDWCKNRRRVFYIGFNSPPDWPLSCNCRPCVHVKR